MLTKKIQPFPPRQILPIAPRQRTVRKTPITRPSPDGANRVILPINPKEEVMKSGQKRFFRNVMR